MGDRASEHFPFHPPYRIAGAAGGDIVERASIDRLIINSPYGEPARHWSYDRERRAFSLADGRRPAGYVIASEGSRSFDDPGHFVEIPLVNRIRPRVRVWREAGYPGVTGITKRLLEHWTNPEEFDSRRFFFCTTGGRRDADLARRGTSGR